MVQPINNSINRSNYSGVNINIKKPEVNAGDNLDTIHTANGDYSAVNINIDNPVVNTAPQKKIYDYPEMNGFVPFDMTNIQPIPLPQGFHVAYQTTNVILPEMENEVELKGVKADEIEPQKEEAKVVDEQSTEKTPAEEAPVEKTEILPEEENVETVDVPAPNYTTVEEEKGEAMVDKDAAQEDTINDDVKVMEAETEKAEDAEKSEGAKDIKRPEIIPGEEIKPDVDIPLVVSNLTNENFDVQAQQMEEIARISLDNPENAVPYIVRDVFATLIDITKKDTAELAAPTDEQIQARKKVIANYVSMENGKANNKPAQMPYPMSEREIALADEISPMEQAERNKEYALYTMAILAKVYTDEVEKETGNIVPMTDIPGTSAMVDSLRYNPNAGVKIAAIDALRHINRPEYKEEMSTLFSLAQADTNPEVAIAATRALNSLEN